MKIRLPSRALARETGELYLLFDDIERWHYTKQRLSLFEKTLTLETEPIYTPLLQLALERWRERRAHRMDTWHRQAAIHPQEIPHPLMSYDA